MKQILQAISKTHKSGIIHRDLKPGNIIYSLTSKKIKIIDWGLAEFYHPNHKYNLRVSTRPYKCPEILVGQRQYDYSFDVWGLGCLFFCLLFRKPYITLGSNDSEQLIYLCKFFGSKDIVEYCTDVGIEIREEVGSFLEIYYRNERRWESFVDNNNIDLYDKKGLRLLDLMLKMDLVF